MLTVKEFNALELEYKLFELRQNQVEVWPLAREIIYDELNTAINGSPSRKSSDKALPLKSKLIGLLWISINSIKFFWQRYPKITYLFFAHPRRKLENGYYHDVYTDSLIKLFGESCAVAEPLFNMSHLSPTPQENLIPLDVMDFWPRALSSFWKVGFKPEVDSSILAFEKMLSQRYNVNVPVQNILRRELTRFIIAKPLVTRLLNQLQPSVLIEIVGYHRLAKVFNVITRQKGIRTIELQHGYVSKAHISYNFPQGVQKVQSFPSYIGLWGNVYKHHISPPLPNHNIFSAGFLYFEEKHKKLRQSVPKANTVVFISQWTIGKELAKLAVDLSKMIPDVSIIYRLHPEERKNARVNYPELYQEQRIIVDDSNSDLYELLINTETIVGVYSTALIEAAMLGKQVVVAKLPGWEAFKDLTESTSSFEFSENSASSLLTTIKSNKSGHQAISYVDWLAPFDIAAFEALTK